MNKTLLIAIIVTASFLGLSLFGSVGMGDNSEHTYCLASSLIGADCPRDSGIAAFVNFHASALQALSLAVAQGAVLYLIVFSIFALSFDLNSFYSSIKYALANYQKNQEDQIVFPLLNKFIYWFSFLKLSPPLNT